MNGPYDVVGALNAGGTICEGYAVVYREIARRMGFYCEKIVSRKMNHTWNFIVVDGVGYYTDVTWEDGGNQLFNMLLGQKIKELRLENGVLQRQLASFLEIDTPMFSKIERGDRRAKRIQVVQIANYFNVDEKELLTLWVADKVLDAVEDEEELKWDAIKVAQSSISL